MQGRQITILVIEDSRLLRVAITKILMNAGYEVVAVGDGSDGLQRAHEIAPDVILLDMMLPTLEGTSVLRLLKKNSLTKAIPVVVLSGLSQKNGKKLLADGAARYLEKSVLNFDGNGGALIEVVKSLLPEKAGEVAATSEIIA